jgi:small GTP-binding protein
MANTKVLKIIITGEGGVGKTTLLHRFIEGKFIVDTRMTIGVEFFLKLLLQIWDFGGQDRFRFLLKNYAKGAKGAIFMFDLTRPLTLENIGDWVEICRGEQPDLPILCVGSKTDLKDLITVEEESLIEIRQKYKFFEYLKVSSKTGENVSLAFLLLAKEIANLQEKV